jgi:hypothetical protein
MARTGQRTVPGRRRFQAPRHAGRGLQPHHFTQVNGREVMQMSEGARWQAVLRALTRAWALAVASGLDPAVTEREAARTAAVTAALTSGSCVPRRRSRACLIRKF